MEAVSDCEAELDADADIVHEAVPEALGVSDELLVIDWEAELDSVKLDVPDSLGEADVEAVADSDAD